MDSDNNTKTLDNDNNTQMANGQSDSNIAGEIADAMNDDNPPVRQVAVDNNNTNGETGSANNQQNFDSSQVDLTPFEPHRSEYEISEADRNNADGSQYTQPASYYDHTEYFNRKKAYENDSLSNFGRFKLSMKNLMLPSHDDIRSRPLNTDNPEFYEKFGSLKQVITDKSKVTAYDVIYFFLKCYDLNKFWARIEDKSERLRCEGRKSYIFN